MHRTLVLLLLLASAAFAGTAEVPFGDRIDQSILNYHRATPNIATAGVISPAGLTLLKSLGFKTLLDLRTAAEGTAAERDAAATQGLSYHNIEIGGDPPTAEQLAEFTTIVESNDSYPLLIHCASGNRVGSVWAMYRVAHGVPLAEALQEGQTMGMRSSRESQVTEYAASLAR